MTKVVSFVRELTNQRDVATLVYLQARIDAALMELSTERESKRVAVLCCRCPTMPTVVLEWRSSILGGTNTGLRRLARGVLPWPAKSQELNDRHDHGRNNQHRRDRLGRVDGQRQPRRRVSKAADRPCPTSKPLKRLYPRAVGTASMTLAGAAWGGCCRSRPSTPPRMTMVARRPLSGSSTTPYACASVTASGMIDHQCGSHDAARHRRKAPHGGGISRRPASRELKAPPHGGHDQAYHDHGRPRPGRIRSCAPVGEGQRDTNEGQCRPGPRRDPVGCHVRLLLCRAAWPACGE